MKIMKVLKWLKAHVLYIIGGLIILFSIVLLVTPLEFTDIPGGVWIFFNGIGLAFFRSLISEVSKGDNKGWKSYTSAGVITVIGSLKLAGIEIPADLMNTILLFLNGFGINGMKAAITKIPLIK